jgi:hypothetical protein
MPKSFVDEILLTPDGSTFLANVVASHDENLVNQVQLADFFQRCAAARVVEPTVKPLKIVRDVCIGADGGPGFRRIHRSALISANRLSTIVTWQRWMTYHVDQARLQAKASSPIIFSPGPGENPRELALIVQNVCSDPLWWWKRGTDEACLGGPMSTTGNCWFSTFDLDVGHALPAGHVSGNAYRVSRATGLDTKKDEWILRYSVDADEVRKAIGREFARPAFGDGGNNWFRVTNHSPYGRHCATFEWGNTADLASERAGVCDGRPERVALRVPFSDIPSLQVQLIGKVEATSADPPMMTAADFEAMIFNGASPHSIASKLKSLLS